MIIRDGEILRPNMRRERMTVMELESEMRLAGISSLADVAWAILEPNGKISFIDFKEARTRQKDTSDAD